jgi:Tol biopolymer transport system component
MATIEAADSGDSEPSMSKASNRLFISSTRSGRRKIWALDMAGGQPTPLTSGDSLDQRPVVSPDGTQVAYISTRDGHRGIWVVPAAGGAPRLVVSGAVLDRVSWSSDGRRLVYALAGDASTSLWIAEVSGGNPVQIAGGSGRTPAWSPTGDVIAVVRSDATSRQYTSSPRPVRRRASL